HPARRRGIWHVPDRRCQPPGLAGHHGGQGRRGAPGERSRDHAAGSTDAAGARLAGAGDPPGDHVVRVPAPAGVVRPAGFPRSVMSTHAGSELIYVRAGHLEGLRRRPIALFVIGGALLLAALLASITFGSVSLPASDTFAVLFHRLFGWPAVTWPQT